MNELDARRRKAAIRSIRELAKPTQLSDNAVDAIIEYFWPIAAPAVPPAVVDALVCSICDAGTGMSCTMSNCPRQQREAMERSAVVDERPTFADECRGEAAWLREDDFSVRDPVWLKERLALTAELLERAAVRTDRSGS